MNCVQWHPEESLLYSGSDDTNIIEWDLQTGKMRRSVHSDYCPLQMRFDVSLSCPVYWLFAQMYVGALEFLTSTACRENIIIHVLL